MAYMDTLKTIAAALIEDRRTTYNLLTHSERMALREAWIRERVSDWDILDIFNTDDSVAWLRESVIEMLAGDGDIYNLQYDITQLVSATFDKVIEEWLHDEESRHWQYARFEGEE